MKLSAIAYYLYYMHCNILHNCRMHAYAKIPVTVTHSGVLSVSQDLAMESTVFLLLLVAEFAFTAASFSLSLSLGVLSEEQIRLKKLKKQEDDQARTVVTRPNPPQTPSTSHKLTPEQLNMIDKLVAAQQQCNRRSFTDRLKVTVRAEKSRLQIRD